MTTAPVATAPFGTISNDISGPAVTRCQLGGTGVARWKQLVNGMHLEGRWNCVEYVTLLPGASIGEHLHARTEEIYYIVTGRAVMHINGERLEVGEGDLITTPIGARHTIANAGTGEMSFYVTEVFPGEGAAAAPQHLRVRVALRAVTGFRGTGTSLSVNSVDLAPHFTGDWHSFHEVVIPPGGSLGPYRIPDRVEVLFVLDGEVSVTVQEEVLTGGTGFCIAVPHGSERTVVNRSADRPLRLISTEVFAR
ncbi:cupin domain-containing protein [Streptomyces sp. NPDC002536]